MEMTTEEIVRDYRQAADKNNQITVLADLNLCKKQDIAELLLAAGEEVPRHFLGQKKSRESREARAAQKAAEKQLPAPKPEAPKPTAVKDDSLRLMLDDYERSVAAAKAAEAAIRAVEDVIREWGTEDEALILREIAGVLRMYRRMVGKEAET